MRYFRLAALLGALLFAFPLFAQDKATKQLTLTVNPATVSITTASVPNGEVGLSYSVTIAATGGLTPYVWTISAGSLPGGLTINAGTGAISGTPTASGTFNFTAQAADSETPAVTATQAYTMTVYTALSIATASLPSATVGTAYSTALSATGGLSPYTWAVTTGSLPAGITLSTAGVLSGTPTTAGAFTFTVTVTDSATNVSELKIKVKIQSAALRKKTRINKA